MIPDILTKEFNLVQYVFIPAKLVLYPQQIVYLVKELILDRDPELFVNVGTDIMIMDMIVYAKAVVKFVKLVMVLTIMIV